MKMPPDIAVLAIPLKLLDDTLFRRAEILLLAYLVRWEALGTLDKAKWFNCPQDHILEELGFSISTQTRLFKRLEEDLLLIETRRIGFRRKREIRLLSNRRVVKDLRQVLR